MAAMQTGARRATSATGAKTSKGKNGEVIVEKVMTSDSFLSREIKKAPLIEHDGSLVADISHIPNDLKITIQGAREHNLKNVDLAIPRNRMVVFTGLSGSGKSSLAFDTLFAEGQRRYVESLSAYARQFLGQMDKPDVDFIEGLSPAVSIDQKTTNRNPRSTVGTITEIYDYLRLLFARTGIPHCPECGEPVASQTPQQIVDTLLGYPERTRFQILAPVVKGRKGEFVDMIELLRSDGYARALIDGEMTQLSDDIKLTKQKKHTIEVVVDRLVVKDGIRQRLTDSVETALKLANGSIIIDFVDEEEGSPVRRQPFSEHRSCPNGHTLELDEVEPRTFSFNAPCAASHVQFIDDKNAFQIGHIAITKKQLQFRSGRRQGDRFVVFMIRQADFEYIRLKTGGIGVPYRGKPILDDIGNVLAVGDQSVGRFDRNFCHGIFGLFFRNGLHIP